MPSVSSAAGRARLGGVLMGLQALVLLALAGLLVLDTARGRVDGTTQALTEAGITAVFAAGAAVLAGGVARRREWARTPTLLWNALLVPVAFSMLGHGRTPLGAAVLAIAVTTAVATWTSTPPASAGSDVARRGADSS